MVGVVVCCVYKRFSKSCSGQEEFLPLFVVLFNLFERMT